MSDLPPNPAMPSRADVDAAVGALTDQFVGHGSNLALAPKNLSPANAGWDLQSWNVGQLTGGLANHPKSIDDIVTLARQMFPGYDRFPPENQQYALQIANVSWYAQNNTPLAGANKTAGTEQIPNLALDAAARQKYGADAWMLNIPEIRVVLEKAAQFGWDQQTLEAQVRSTKWWQTTSQAQQEFAQLQATSPEELNFADTGSQASLRLAHIQDLAANAGITLGPASLQKIALQSMEFNWGDEAMRQAMAAQVAYDPAGAQNNVGAVAQQLASVNNDYLISNDTGAMKQWATGLVGGTQTIDQYKAYASAQAASKYAWAVPQLNEGQTMNQITGSLRSQAAQLMEVDPTTIDFVNNPTYQKILDYVAPGDTVHRAMTGAEAGTYLRGTSAWGNTQQAKDQVGTWASNLLKTFGVVAQ